MPIKMTCNGKIETNPRRIQMVISCPEYEAAGNAGIYIDTARRILKQDGEYRDEEKGKFTVAASVFAHDAVKGLERFNYRTAVICFNSQQSGGNLVHTVECNGSKAVISEQF